MLFRIVPDRLFKYRVGGFTYFEEFCIINVGKRLIYKSFKCMVNSSLCIIGYLSYTFTE